MPILTRRTALTLLGAAPLAAALPRLAAGATALQWTALRGGENDFFRAPVLVTGERDAILIDGSFNFPAGRALVDAIEATGKRLTTIYVTCNDPDYYFSLTPVAATFPDARIIAAPETIALMKKKAPGKLATWGPVLGENGPQSLDELVFPEPYDGVSLELEGAALEIVTSRDMVDRRYVWVPSLGAVFGGVHAFEGLHVWTADTPEPEDRAAWIAELDALIAREPKIVVAGHAATGLDNGVDSLAFTRRYLVDYEAEVATAADSGELVAAMLRRYPDLGLQTGLEIGAKVVMGEMSWGD